MSYGGVDVESDENLRERIQIAPESFSVAGSRGAYEFWARTAHQGIVDVAVLGPPDTTPGHVEIYPLLTGGEMPTQDILDAVYSVCNAEDMRPMTDYVHVLSPVAVNYDVNVTYWIDRSRATQAAAMQAAATGAVNAWINWQRSKLGRDINPSELSHRLIAAGAKRASIRSPSFTVLAGSQVAVPGAVSVTFGGLEDG
jgi:phage-related baseplate assembly protein